MRRNGFSLFDCLLSVTILTTALLTAIPFFNRNILDWKFEQEFRALLEDLKLARSTAAHQNQKTLIQPLTHWSDGWIIFIDKNDNGIFDGADLLIKRQTAIKQTYIKSVNPLRNYIAYTGTGEARFISDRSSGAMMIGSLTLCARHDQALTKKIIISKGGRIRVKTNPATGCS